MKEFAEHLRTTHFILIALSGALLFGAVTETRTVQALAYAELQDVKKLMGVWDDSFIDGQVHQALKRVASDGTTFYRAYAVLGPNGKKFTVPIATSWHLLSENEDVRSIDRRDLLPAPRPTASYTLAEVAQLWDRLNLYRQISFAEVTTGECFVIAGTALERCRLTAESPIGPTRTPQDWFEGLRFMNGAKVRELAKPEQLLRLPDAAANVVKARFGNMGYFLDPLSLGRPQVIIEADAMTAPIDLLSAWCVRAAIQPPIGKFNDAFRNLADVSQRLMDLRLETLALHVADERDRARDAIDVGIGKIPADTLATGGTLSLLLVWGYLLLSLREFLDRVHSKSDAWDVAWLPLYQNHSALGVFALTIIVLPIATIVALMVIAFRAAASVVEFLIFGGLTALLTLAVASYAVVLLRRLRHLRRNRLR